MLIREYGLFWEANEVLWFPGRGQRKQFRLLGRIGAHVTKLQLCDFRAQQGIYVLYNHHGVYYVGLTRKKGFGNRLRDHLVDQHKGKWARFSWFGFRKALVSRESDGCQRLAKMAKLSLANVGDTIGDVEALLIKSVGANANKADMNFKSAREWSQVPRDEYEHWIAKLK